MIDSGQLDIDIAWDGELVRRVHIASSRPLAARVLVGRSVMEALALVPMLFSLCGRAQSLCARVAASVLERDEEIDYADAHAALAAEMAFEHLWRLWIDWPAALDLPPDRPALVAAAAALRTCSTRSNALAAAAVVGGALERIVAHDAPALLGALERHELRASIKNRVKPLPYAALADVRLGFPIGLADGFAQTPTWYDAPAETGPVIAYAHDARVADLQQDGWEIGARLMARVVALEHCLGVLRGATPPERWIDAQALDANHALARVETARGMLLHRMRLDEGRIAEYTIVAPTEWNFHPRGALAAALEGCAVRDAGALRSHVEAWVLALDPCVERQISIRPVARA